MTYRIGQLLYIVSNKTKTIEPIQVTSKQTLEDLTGTTVQHMCAGTSGKTFALEEHVNNQSLAGVFESVDEAESHLLILATDMVRKLSVAAREKAQLFESSAGKQEQPSTPDSSLLSNEIQTITLQDGTQARVHLPEEIL
tara:strand:- start:8132 stop:8551 length:420 start_codon:yes stop_codon:yes gene_type:complete